MSGSYKEAYGSSEGQEDSTKKGLCFLELRRAGMVQWGELGQISSVDQYQDPQLSSFAVKQEQSNEDVMAASLVSPQVRKRLKDSKSVRQLKQKQTTICKKLKHEKSIGGQRENKVSNKEGFIDRWSIERYKVAEKSMLEVMKAEGATVENPIPRSALRVVARKYIPDTGLLDHLLKHINGRVAPGGTERFRRCYNTQGIMEYWLESTDMDRIKLENGVPGSDFVPLSCWISGRAAIQQSVSSGETALLKEEVARLKRDMEELVLKNKEQNQANHVQDMLKELRTWRAGTDQRLVEISSSLSGVQNMYQDLISWKSQAEKKLMEISGSMNSAPATKQCSSSLSPVSERWEDWLEKNNLDNIQGEELVPWVGRTDLLSVGQDALLQDCSGSQLWSGPASFFQGANCELLNEDMVQVNSNAQYVLPERRKDGQASVSPDSSATKCDLENPFLLFQEMVNELMKWRGKMEEQMVEIWNAVSNLQQ